MGCKLVTEYLNRVLRKLFVSLAILYFSVMFCVPHNHAFEIHTVRNSFPAREKEYTENNALISKEAKDHTRVGFVLM